MKVERAVFFSLLIVGCGDHLPGAPVVEAVQPSRVSDLNPTTMNVFGDFLFARVDVTYGEGGANPRVLVPSIGGVLLEPTRTAPGRFEVTLPSGFKQGVHDLVVIDPDQRQFTLEGAVEVYRGDCAEIDAGGASECPSRCPASLGCACAVDRCVAVCGDGIVRAPEICDGPGCDVSCGLGAPECGNGILAPSEGCDDGNLDAADGCAADCTIEPGFECIVVRHTRRTLCFEIATSVFVDGDGCAAPGAGTIDDPYCAIQQAIDDRAGRPNIIVRPHNYFEPIDLPADLSFRRMVGEVGATISATTSSALEVTGGGEIEIVGFSIISQRGIRLLGDQSKLTLTGNELLGAKFSGETGTGVSATGGTLFMSQNLIHGFDGGGIDVESADFRMINNVVAGNGSSDASSGGVRIGDGATVVFAHNTIADNTAETSPTGAAGVLCDTPATILNSIVWGNVASDGALGPFEPSAVRGCETRSSLLEVPNPLGVDDLHVDPRFVPGDRSYHLAGDSPCVDRGAETQDAVPADLDDDPRPRGGRPDIGADEAR